MALLDGFVSYLGDVIAAHAPQAQWQVCHHRIKRYHLQNHPVLTSPLNDADVHPPHLVAAEASRMRGLMKPLREDLFTTWATDVITELRGQNEPVPMVEEPLVEVEYEHGVFGVGLHEELAHEHSRKVDRMVKDLKAQPGVTSACREDRETVLVSAPDWNSEQLQRWVTDWITRHVPAMG